MEEKANANTVSQTPRNTQFNSTGFIYNNATKNSRSKLNFNQTQPRFNVQDTESSDPNISIKYFSSGPYIQKRLPKTHRSVNQKLKSFAHHQDEGTFTGSSTIGHQTLAQTGTEFNKH